MGRGPLSPVRCPPSRPSPAAGVFPQPGREGSLGAGCSFLSASSASRAWRSGFSQAFKCPQTPSYPSKLQRNWKRRVQFLTSREMPPSEGSASPGCPRCAAPLPGGERRPGGGTGAGQAAKGPPPPPPAPLALLKVPGDPASLWDGVREIALSGGKKIIFTETKSACRGGGSDSEKVASILSAVGNSATTCVYCCSPARQISAFVCNSRDNAVLLGHCFEPG